MNTKTPGAKFIPAIKDVLNRITSNPKAKKLGEVFTVLLGGWFLIAFIGMFFEKRFPFIHPFVFWTLRIGGAVWMGTLTVLAVGLMVIAPGFYIARELHDHVLDPRASPLETGMTLLWSGCAGVLASSTIGFLIYLMLCGRIANVKMWFVGVCQVLVLLPWLGIGILGRKIIRHFSPPDDRFIVEKWRASVLEAASRHAPH